MGLFAGTPFDRPLRCEVCEELEEDCTCPPPAAEVIPPEKQQLRVAVEKRKKGKTVTVVRDLADQPEVVAELLTTLKTACGAGGTVKEGVVEIQGDHLSRVQDKLKSLGYRLRK
ncbi:MAG: translation initiation factor [Planctomyces sp.]|nr:translation initiation factor [Planctomyces sp.]